MPSDLSFKVLQDDNKRRFQKNKVVHGMELNGNAMQYGNKVPKQEAL